MQPAAKRALFGGAGALSLLLMVWLVLNKLAVVAVLQTHEVEPPPLLLPTDAGAVARGAHLAHAVLGCPACHGADLAGGPLLRRPHWAQVSAANLTQPRRATRTLVRALRYGVRDDDRGLWMMPTDAYAALDDADLGDLVRYLQQLTPVPRTLAANRLEALGRAAVAWGRWRLIQANAAPPLPAPRAAPQSAAHGAYLFRVARCQQCHGAGGDGVSLAALSGWHEADFFAAMRRGRRPDGRIIDAAAMPWPQFAALGDDELRALWLHLHGN